VAFIFLLPGIVFSSKEYKISAMVTAVKKAKSPAKKTKTPRRKATIAKKDVSASYNRYKEYHGKQYSGMQVGRSHKWYYDKGEWKETKVTPDLWRIYYAVTKRRAGKAPEGSGAKVGTAYHWYIAAHQRVQKLNADDYSTILTGLKYKIAHKRADNDKWSAKAPTQRDHLIKFLKEWIKQLEEEVIPLQLDYNGETFKGEAVPVPGTCEEGVCFQMEVTLNDESLGIIRAGKSGWKMDMVKDQKFVDAIGNEIQLYYE
jgi:hypothetical protein